nr:hypothetical protein [uncultured Granulicatella sp.]
MQYRILNHFKRIQQRCLLTLQDSVKEIKVVFSTFKWEGGQSMSNFSTMKNAKEFCLKSNNYYSSGIEEVK